MNESIVSINQSIINQSSSVTTMIDIGNSIMMIDDDD